MTPEERARRMIEHLQKLPRYGRSSSYPHGWPHGGEEYIAKQIHEALREDRLLTCQPERALIVR